MLVNAQILTSQNFWFWLKDFCFIVLPADSSIRNPKFEEKKLKKGCPCFAAEKF